MATVVEYPEMIKEHKVTEFPAVTSDFMPTILDMLDITPEHPDWAQDGISIMGVFNGSIDTNT